MEELEDEARVSKNSPPREDSGQIIEEQRHDTEGSPKTYFRGSVETLAVKTSNEGGFVQPQLYPPPDVRSALQ